MALVFRDNPEAPLKCAIGNGSEAVGQAGTLALQLRMGIHSGPVNEVVDVNGRTNITGAGINIAQRVMDCGDAGHILLSRHVADDLEQYPQWRDHLHELGQVEVKHGAKIDVVNFYNDEAGNAEATGASSNRQPRRENQGPSPFFLSRQTQAGLSSARPCLLALAF